MASVKRVLIVGGGSAGMALATALQRSGIDAVNVEINPTWSAMRLAYRPFGSLRVPPPCFRGGRRPRRRVGQGKRCPGGAYVAE